MSKHVLVVLDDGETYSGLDGCTILIVNDEGMEEIIEVSDASAVSRENVLSEIRLGDYSNE